LNQWIRQQAIEKIAIERNSKPGSGLCIWIYCVYMLSIKMFCRYKHLWVNEQIHKWVQ
jgi:hypothetical protein